MTEVPSPGDVHLLPEGTGRDAVILLSGGLDSMVTAGLAKEAGYRINAITFQYGQRHCREVEAARDIAGAIGVHRHLVLPLDLASIGGSALTADIAVPKAGLSDDIPVTYVPARNLIFLSLTLAWAEVIEARDLFIGVNAVDYSGYPDCRPEFIEAFATLANLATKAGANGANFAIHTPLQRLSKAAIALEARRLGLEPGLSWSCYDPRPDGKACGLCDSCRLRKAGFQDAGLEDATDYAA